ncbi:MAG: HAMP domain-containing histidine kinase, partial [Clostridia bacterium]|nr:HAMP domain-containing histidine kinase [Clostridia bacterium]
MNFRQYMRDLLRWPFRGIWAMFRSRGITRRWIRNSFMTIALVLLVAMAFITASTQSSYYSSVRTALLSRGAATADYYYSIAGSARNSAAFRASAFTFAETFENRDRMELQILDGYGNIIVSSTGFDHEEDKVMPDYYSALESSDGAACWDGSNKSGEHVMAVTHLLSVEEGRSAGALRFVVSLEQIDTYIVGLAVLLLITSCIVLFLVLMSGNYFISSILVPVANISKAANRISKGDFSVRIQSEYNDELGELADAINAMATELASSEKLKNDFISSVSHELRTPLTSIKGWSETVRGENTDIELLGRAMGVISRETDRLSVLVEDLLDFSRLQSGRIRMSFEKVDLIAELEEAVMTAQKHAESENVRIVTELGVELPVVAADRNRIMQVFIN